MFVRVGGKLHNLGRVETVDLDSAGSVRLWFAGAAEPVNVTGDNAVELREKLLAIAEYQLEAVNAALRGL